MNVYIESVKHPMKQQKVVIFHYVLALIVCLTFSAAAQEKGASTITASELKMHLSFIASDELRGRNTPSPELKIAARYLATRAAAYGLQPLMPDSTFFQKINLPIISYDEKRTALTLTNSTGDQVFRFPEMFGVGQRSDEGTYTGSVVFLGFGVSAPDSSWDDYDGVDLTGKIAVILDAQLPAGHALSSVENRQLIRSRFMEPRKWGAAGVLRVIREEREHDMDLNAYDFDNIERGIFPELHPDNEEVSVTGQSGPDQNMRRNPPGPMESPYFIGEIRHEAAAVVLGITRDKLKAMFSKINRGEPVPAEDLSDRSITVSVIPKIREGHTQNVVAALEGSDPALKNEYVIFGAHYDHDGSRSGQIWNGADDDGSGTVALLEIAQAFAQDPPRRSVLFVWHAGEEKGLRGSDYFTSYPPVPLENVSSQINIDMVGRNDPERVFVIGAGRISTELDSIVQHVNSSRISMELDYTFDAPNDPNQFYYRSDHYMYAQYGIPIAFFFTDVHEDYHRPTDTYDKINYRKLERIARLAYYLGYEIAEKNEMLKLDADPDVKKRGKFYPDPRKR